MTEKAAGADATGMQTKAELDGDEWVLNGEKWFSSSASVADIAVVMAKTDPDAPRHEQYSTFIVELPNPGYQILRNIETMQPHTDLGLKLGGSHSEINIENLRVPRENILGSPPQIRLTSPEHSREPPANPLNVAGTFPLRRPQGKRP